MPVVRKEPDRDTTPACLRGKPAHIHLAGRLELSEAHHLTGDEDGEGHTEFVQRTLGPRDCDTKASRGTWRMGPSGTAMENYAWDDGMIEPSHSVGVLGFAECDGRVLLVRSTYSKRWQLPGGFVNPEERLEDALRREFNEELGVDVSVGSAVGLYVRLWDDNLVIVFRVTVSVEELRPDPEEIEAVGWFSEDDVPIPSSPRTLRMIRDARRGNSLGVVTFRDELDAGSPCGR